MQQDHRLLLFGHGATEMVSALPVDFLAFRADGLLPTKLTVKMANNGIGHTGARDGTRADGVLDRGRRRLFSFWLYCLAAPSSYRVDRGRHLAASPFGTFENTRH